MSIKNGGNIMPPSIEAAKAGVTTGEWSQVLRDCVRGVSCTDRRRLPQPAPIPRTSSEEVRQWYADRVDDDLGPGWDVD